MLHDELPPITSSDKVHILRYCKYQRLGMLTHYLLKRLDRYKSSIITPYHIHIFCADTKTVEQIHQFKYLDTIINENKTRQIWKSFKNLTIQCNFCETEKNANSLESLISLESDNVAVLRLSSYYMVFQNGHLINKQRSWCHLRFGFIDVYWGSFLGRLRIF